MISNAKRLKGKGSTTASDSAKQNAEYVFVKVTDGKFGFFQLSDKVIAMKTKYRFLTTVRIMFLWTLVMGTTLIVMPPETWADEWVESSTGEPLLIFKSKPDKKIQATSRNLRRPNVVQALHSKVELFYPTRGQSSAGDCWAGLRIDSHDNIYPAAFGSGIGRILPNGTLINGVDDQNLFKYGINSAWFELDERGGNFYSSSFFNVYVAPFVRGSYDSVLISGLTNGQGITLGRGFLAGSLFISEASENQVSRLTLSPLRLSVFASGSAFFSYPEAIAAAPNGTLYVANLGFNPPRLTKVTSTGVPSIFAIGTFSQANGRGSGALIVDKERNVYWSHDNGFNKYDARGNLLGTLPRPPVTPPIDFPQGSWGPMGSAFDSKGNLYVVNNWECKTIYKYTLPVTNNQCRNGGWQTFGFKNQGQCIRFVNKPGQG
jgi:hypothetical protein